MSGIRRRSWFGLLAVFAMVASISVSRADDHESVSETPIWFGTEMSLAPDGETEGAWRCRVILTDLGSDEVLSVPTIRFEAGEEATVTSEIRPGMLFEFRIEVDDVGRSANWSSQIRVDDQILSSGSGTVQLVSS